MREGYSDARVRVGAFTLAPLSHRLQGPSGAVQLSPLASRFLQALARRQGAVATRSELIDELWNGDYLVGDPALNRVVSETRRAVGDSPQRPVLIQTVHRRGYRLVVPSPATPSQGKRVMWTRLWAMALTTFAVVIGGLALLIAVATLSRVFR